MFLNFLETKKLECLYLASLTDIWRCSLLAGRVNYEKKVL